MRILFLDLASHSSSPDAGASIACVTDEKTVAIRFVDHRMGDDSLMPLLEEVMRDAGWKDEDLTNIACVTGPGGFTSLRMAVTLANVLADQLRIPLAGVHMSDLYAARVDDRASFVWIHATKKKELFVRGFGMHTSLWPEATLITLDDLVSAYPVDTPFAGELLPDQRAVVPVKDVPLAPLADALPSVLRDLSYENASLAPWYGRGW